MIKNCFCNYCVLVQMHFWQSYMQLLSTVGRAALDMNNKITSPILKVNPKFIVFASRPIIEDFCMTFCIRAQLL